MIGDQKTDMIFAKRVKIKGFLFKDGSLYNFVKNKLNNAKNKFHFLKKNRTLLGVGPMSKGIVIAT